MLVIPSITECHKLLCVHMQFYYLMWAAVGELKSERLASET